MRQGKRKGPETQTPHQVRAAQLAASDPIWNNSGNSITRRRTRGLLTVHRCHHSHQSRPKGDEPQQATGPPCLCSFVKSQNTMMTPKPELLRTLEGNSNFTGQGLKAWPETPSNSMSSTARGRMAGGREGRAPVRGRCEREAPDRYCFPVLKHLLRRPAT